MKNKFLLTNVLKMEIEECDFKQKTVTCDNNMFLYCK